MVALVTEELGLVQRWSESLRHSGRVFSVVDAAMLASAQHTAGALCLFDLGRRAGSDPAMLLTAVREFPETRFIALTARLTADEGLLLLRAGVRGYCNRLASPKIIGTILDTVEGGEIWASRQVTDHLLAQALGQSVATSGSRGPALFQNLTRREVEIAKQVAAGRSNKTIAAEAGISERTVKTHLNNIFRKTGVRNRVQLALAINDAELAPRQLSSGRI